MFGFFRSKKTYYIADLDDIAAEYLTKKYLDWRILTLAGDIIARKVQSAVEERIKELPTCEVCGCIVHPYHAGKIEKEAYIGHASDGWEIKEAPMMKTKYWCKLHAPKEKEEKKSGSKGRTATVRKTKWAKA